MPGSILSNSNKRSLAKDNGEKDRIKIIKILQKTTRRLFQFKGSHPVKLVSSFVKTLPSLNSSQFNIVSLSPFIRNLIPKVPPIGNKPVPYQTYPIINIGNNRHMEYGIITTDTINI